MTTWEDYLHFISKEILCDQNTQKIYIKQSVLFHLGNSFWGNNSSNCHALDAYSSFSTLVR